MHKDHTTQAKPKKDEREEVLKEIRQLENRQKILENKQRNEERKARTRRLIERGAILEGVFPLAPGLPGMEVKAFLIALSHLPGAAELAAKLPKSGDKPYVCWVYNQNGYNVGRTTANGLWNKSQHISEAEAKPGDLVFFEGTYDTPGKSHVGIYLGNGMMVSAGDPIKYADIHSSYWQKYLSGFGRLSK